MTLLEVRSATKHFGGVTALDEVSISVDAGEVVALVGDNGAGKSTLVKTIAGYLPPDHGEIRWRGEPVDLRHPTDATALGIETVYQDLALCDNLDTVQNLFLGREKVMYGLFGRRLARAEMEKQARAALDGLNIVTLKSLRTPIGKLSGGQRQSVAVCRSILTDPQLVLLDEPTAALGVAQRREVLDLIRRVRDQNRGVLLISHDLADVKEVSDRVVVLRLGRTVAELDGASCTHEELIAHITGAATGGVSS
ncbi:ATP-binding cassette domain-containing protein [Conexibacter stalactiti]|uniref:ATP-binding cassette domain-containing protein n=1 Tax=Conexibacter stalactiti TaxID=1940611 RepID=A0ABU4HID9_9ACTN|nr:ATP-binding cassette domain-containing protein [Conexibacter stalactiti]MDW5593079.1 ATP-binding cassette domain-containing protein [Conexibacter stalactiti]MEC5033720.1 ATP-binding cassette domain-containing protein [Conexibacter stalactiti]